MKREFPFGKTNIGFAGKVLGKGKMKVPLENSKKNEGGKDNGWSNAEINWSVS